MADLRRRRLRAKISLRQLARAMEISHTHLHDMERRRRGMSDAHRANYLRCLVQLGST